MTLINYLPSVLSGRNSEVFPNILRFYLPRGGLVCDLNYGRGKFYQSLEEDNLMIIGCDILPSLPVVIGHIPVLDDLFLVGFVPVKILGILVGAVTFPGFDPLFQLLKPG